MCVVALFHASQRESLTNRTFKRGGALFGMERESHAFGAIALPLWHPWWVKKMRPQMCKLGGQGGIGSIAVQQNSAIGSDARIGVATEADQRCRGIGREQPSCRGQR